MSNLGDRLRLLIIEKALKQKDVSLELGIKLSTFSGYINNKREPGVHNLMLMANYFNVSVDYLIGHSDSRCSNLSHLSPQFIDFVCSPENIPYLDRALKEKMSKERSILQRIRRKA